MAISCGRRKARFLRHTFLVAAMSTVGISLMLIGARTLRGEENIRHTRQQFNNQIFDKPRRPIQESPQRYYYKHENLTQNTAQFSRQNVTCKFPELDPFDPATQKFFPVFQTVQCNGTPVITTVQNGVLRYHDKATLKQLVGQAYPPNCQYRAILRHPETTILFLTSPWKGPLQDGHVFPKDENHIHVKCFDDNKKLVAEAYHTIIHVRPEEEAARDRLFQQHMREIRPKESLNVILLGIDSTSRMNYIRSLPRTRQLLTSMGGVEMKMHNKIADNTVPNLTGFLTGLYVHEQTRHWKVTEHMDGWDFLWHHYKKAGYTTFMGEDFVNAYDEHLFHSKVHKGLAKMPTDYCFRPLTAYIMETRNGTTDEAQCLGASREIDITLGYLRQFIDAFKDKPHFAMTWLWRYSHKNPAMTRATDEIYFNFIRGLQEDHRLDNSLLVFFSDHGSRYGEFRSTFNGMIEERAPFLTLVFPTWFQEKYPEIMATLRINSHRFTTHFDTHQTLLDILQFDGKTGRGDINQRGISLFQTIPRERTCKDADIDSHWCLCRTITPPGSLSQETKSYLAQVLLLHVNTIVKKEEDLCVRFKLTEVMSVIKQTAQERTDLERPAGDKGGVTYVVTIKATPGDAIFEGTLVQGHTNQATVNSDVSRLSSYQGQSDCMTKPIMKLYCYCYSIHPKANDSVGLREDIM